MKRRNLVLIQAGSTFIVDRRYNVFCLSSAFQICNMRLFPAKCCQKVLWLLIFVIMILFAVYSIMNLPFYMCPFSLTVCQRWGDIYPTYAVCLGRPICLWLYMSWSVLVESDLHATHYIIIHAYTSWSHAQVHIGTQSEAAMRSCSSAMRCSAYCLTCPSVLSFVTCNPHNGLATYVAAWPPVGNYL